MLQIEGPTFESTLPFAWQAGVFKSSATEWEIVRYLMVLADFEQTPVSIELAQAKQDLLLLWLAKNQSISLPNAQQVQMGLSQVSWLNHEPIEVGSTGAIQFAFSALFPFLLKLKVIVIACTPVQAGHRVIVQFCDLSPVVQDQIEQTIFRYHRRAIQNAKQTNL
ncbi:PilZ domain-containing protein [Chitinibacter bivalviorum]|uniref:PilZ domain-containing protein n=1 Tax=Chitinibacter bivalviorum TaxID=2739434 RepID=A0A7H9BFQ2_9NEIS|nr:PilZ domain-containing protein [Chitinibacter bivalviorum]QLG87543.1 PilZ domain-containing protein [Chitinibacter bivalviorum]